MEQNSEPLPDKLGTYQIKRKLGQGGMGEVFLAYDPLCKRDIALKRMRSELSQNSTLQKRFLREALIAAHLSHPSIIPIYSIHREDKSVFYTMPYVEGETLKQIIHASKKEEKEGEIRHPIGSSIPSLAHIFLKVCQAIAFAHAKRILHRDVKPDNIIVGKYGEVLLFDWGLAEEMENQDVPLSAEISLATELTKPGKVPGTLLYLAPERILGSPSSPRTDIYALGVILYQILTLHLPFHRRSLEQVRKTMRFEKIIEPQEIAPYRDIPEHLADVVKRCLCFDPAERFQSVDAIIEELGSYIEGRPEWIPTNELDIQNKSDWEFQENILLAKHMAITRSPDVLEWVSLMISRCGFSGNMRLDTRIKIQEGGSGIGILLAIPEAAERKGWIEEGYYLWIGSQKQPGVRLFQFNVEVLSLYDLSLKQNTWHQLSIELVDNHFYLYIDETLRCHHVSHVPMRGTHTGLLYKDADFTLEALKISLGSQNAMVNCLAIPDAFLASRLFPKALSEYRRIASSFSGRTEGREALFRAGITLLEQALHQKNRKEKEKLHNAAHEEFSTLRFTPGAPLEFLGKSLLYKAMGDVEEEEKCLELALRKYPKHPLIKVIRDHVTFRLHETAQQNRIAAFHFLLLAAKLLPSIFQIQDNARLFTSMKAHLEPLAFLLPLPPDLSFADELLYFAEQIAFWLVKPMTLIEMIEKERSSFLIANAFLCLLAMGAHKWAAAHAYRCLEEETLKTTLLAKEKGYLFSLKKLSPLSDFSLRCIYYLIDQAILCGKSAEILPILDKLSFNDDVKQSFDALCIWAYLLNNLWDKAHQILMRYPPETLAEEYSPLYFLMGCYLRHAEGKEIALSHFSGSIDMPHPPTPMLLSSYLQGKISEKKNWSASVFSWEKIQLFRQLHLYYHCAKKPDKARFALRKLKKELENQAIVS